MRIMRISSVETGEPVARASRVLMRESRELMTLLSCFNSSSTKPIVATSAGG